MTLVRTVSAITLAAAALAAHAGDASSAAPEEPARTGGALPGDFPRHELVFAHHADAGRRDYDIWRICPDGTQPASLVVAPGHQAVFTVSPDGREIVYASRDAGEVDLWLRPFLRGDDAVRVASHPANDTGPAFSPDGSRLAFLSTRDAERPELYVLDLPSGRPRRLTENDRHDSGATWSPDGARIALTRYFPAEDGEEHAGHGEIVELTVANGAERQLTRLGGYNGQPAYSPDGTKIAFHRVADGGVEIWLMNADGTGARPLTDSFLDEYSPAWSPEGGWIAYTAGTGNDGDGTFDLWLMRADGSDRRLVAPLPNTQMEPAWRPGERRCR